MSVTVLDHPFVLQRLGQLRNRPKNPEFRNYLRDVSRLLAYEASRDFALEDYDIEGNFGPIKVQKLKGKAPSAVPILRAGLGMLDGFLDIFPEAPVSMVGLARNEETLEPMSYYDKLVRDIAERTVFVLDPMLATAGSTNAAIKLLKDAGCKNIYGLFLIASAQGIENVQNIHPDVCIYTCAIDPELNDKGYIIPGLGDAGDFVFSTS